MNERAYDPVYRENYRHGTTDARKRHPGEYCKSRCYCCGRSVYAPLKFCKCERCQYGEYPK